MIDEEPIDVDAHRARGLAVVHAGADERPEPRVVLDEVKAHADEHGEPDEEEAIGRVRHRAKVERARDRRRGLDRARVAPERREAEVGHDERDADRDEHLGQLLAADPAQEESLGHEPDGRGDGDPDRDRRDEVPGDPHRDDARVAAQQEEGAVREVDDAHEAEDEREPAREQEQQSAEAQPVQRLEEQGLGRDRNASLVGSPVR